jgi:hypothetical protein
MALIASGWQSFTKCGRFAAQLPPDLISRLSRTNGDLPNIAASWNVGPTQPAMLIRLNRDTGERTLDLLAR